MSIKGTVQGRLWAGYTPLCSQVLIPGIKSIWLNASMSLSRLSSCNGMGDSSMLQNYFHCYRLIKQVQKGHRCPWGPLGTALLLSTFSLLSALDNVKNFISLATKNKLQKKDHKNSQRVQCKHGLIICIRCLEWSLILLTLTNQMKNLPQFRFVWFVVLHYWGLKWEPPTYKTSSQPLSCTPTLCHNSEIKAPSQAEETLAIRWWFF